MINTKAGALDEKGRELLQEGRFAEAAELFREAYRLVANPVLANNLASALFFGGEAENALEILAPGIAPDADLNPYGHALAAQILVSLGREAQARDKLRQAVQDFDEGWAALRRQGPVPHFWKEYTVIVLRAAGCLGEDRLVYDLYRRWQGLHVMGECAYLAGVAAFNLKRFDQAAKLWARIRDMGALPRAWGHVALLADRGHIPPFSLEYELPMAKRLSEWIDKVRVSVDERRRVVERGMVRLYLLGVALDADADDRAVQFVINALVVYGGEWGKQLGLSLLDAGGVSRGVKLTVAGALVDAGVYRLDEPIYARIDGRKQTLKITKVEITEEADADLEEVMARAVRLRAEGKYEEAMVLLKDLLTGGRFHPPAVIMLANLQCRLGYFEDGRRLLETLEEAYPDDPSVLFNLTALWCDLKNPEKARAYLDRLEKSLEGQETPAEFKEKLALLRLLLRELILPVDAGDLMAWAAEEERETVEAKPLPVDATLARGLKNMPAIWLDGMCSDWEIEPARTRKERAVQIIAYLGEDDHLGRIVEELKEDEAQLLRYLLGRGGWSRIGPVSRKFGTMDGDGYYWDESAPLSPLGSLWCQALVMVGKARIKGRNYKVAVIPVDLRERLSRLLG